MDLEELLKWTDDRVVANTGQHLDSLQKSIWEAIWQHQNYEEVAKNHHVTYHHVKKQAGKLWHILQPTPLPTVIDYFRTDRCLVILDDLQNIFKPGELAGQYLAGYEDYGKFFKQVATTPHQSCLILLSWEKPRDFTALSSQNRLLQAFHLQGIEPQAANFLQEKGLTDEARWSELITLYQGHPTWLNIIAAAIVELCNGSVTEFLSDTDNIFLGDLEPLLSSHLERLSELEIQVSHWLASENEAVDISQPPNNSDLFKSDLWQAIQSLSRRGLVEKVALGAKVRFRINPVFQQYIRSKFG